MEQNSNSLTTDIRKKILEVATSLFAEKGFEGTSIRDIAKEAHVNLAMVSYYFGNKEGLYLECISNFAKSKVAAMQQILGVPDTKEEFKIRFRMFVENKLKAFTDDQYAHKIIMREMQTERDAEFHAKFIEQISPIFDLVKGFFQNAIDKKIIKPNSNSELLAIMMMGIMSHPCISEKAMQHKLGYCLTDEKVRDLYIEQVCELFFAGVLL